MLYSFINFATAANLLAQRLGDPNRTYWNQPNELENAVVESTRLLQLATGSYKQKITFNPVPGQIWYDLPNFLPANNPLAYNVTDVEVANNVLSVLLEPPLTTLWSGTGQFTIDQIRNSLQNRLNRFIGETGCRVVQRMVAGPSPTVNLVDLPSDVMDVRRVAWSPVPPAFTLPPVDSTYQFADEIIPAGIVDGVNTMFTVPQSPDPAASLELYFNGVLIDQGKDYTINLNTITYIVPPNPGDTQIAYYRYQPTAPFTPQTYPLGRIDEWAAVSYSPGNVQTPTTPLSYSVFGTRSLQLRLVPPPLDEGNLECLLVVQGPQIFLDPSNPVVLGIPDDMAAALKWGVLADVLGTDGQSRDYARAAYAEQRYQEFVQMAKIYPSFLIGDVNNVDQTIESVFDDDNYNPTWEQQTGAPQSISATGRNMISLGVIPDTGIYGIGIWCAVNAPVVAVPPDTFNQMFVQISPDLIDPMLDYAQHIASFKMGGVEFEGTGSKYQNFVAAIKSQNSRLNAISFYRSQLQEPNRDEADVLRMTNA